MAQAPLLTTTAPRQPDLMAFGFILTGHLTVQEIASYLPDLDLCSFALVERATCDAVLPKNAGHWRTRFRELYDLPRSKALASIPESYKLRKRYLTHLVNFKLGNSGDEQACLKAIRQLILEVSADFDPSASRNINQLYKFFRKSNLLHDAFRWSHVRFLPGTAVPDRDHHLLTVIRVFFFIWTIQFASEEDFPDFYPVSLRKTCYRLEYSQARVLSLTEPNLHRALVEQNGDIDFVGLNHLINLWKFHLCLNPFGQLMENYANLPWYHRPKLHLDHIWILDTLNIGNLWKGALLCLDTESAANFSYHGVDNNAYTDGYFTGGNDFLDMKLAMAPDGRGCMWPRVFEEATHGMPENLKGLADRLDIPQLRPVEPPLDKASRPKFTRATTSPKSGTEAYSKPLTWRLMTDAVEQLLEANRREGLRFPESGSEVKRVPYRILIGNGDRQCLDNKLRFAAILHPLGCHAGIPGWQRISMVGFYVPKSGTAHRGYLDANPEDFDIAMTYEGVVPPTASAIIGYCKNCNDNVLAEPPIPFLYWTVGDLGEQGEEGDDGHTEADTSSDGEKVYEEELAARKAKENMDELEWAMAMEAAHKRS
ncbi:MAG: hypothetical protein LQ350_001456 [Teloschistes chrysophthalmus]|nr:MAG: hypothetical protein LQ350_001456 [Niorma chrysophthalma]